MQKFDYSTCFLEWRNNPRQKEIVTNLITIPVTIWCGMKFLTDSCCEKQVPENESVGWNWVILSKYHCQVKWSKIIRDFSLIVMFKIDFVEY